MASRKRTRAPLQPLPRARGATGFRGDLVRDEHRRHWEPPEVQAFFEAAREDPFWGPYFQVQYFWGCRVSEPALIGSADLSLDKQEVVITRLKKNAGRKETPFGVREQVHAVPDDLLPAFESVLEWRVENGREDSAWLFPSLRRMHWRRPDLQERMGILRRNAEDPSDAAVSRMAAHRRFKAFADAAGIPRTQHLRRTHVLRHTRATLLIAGGATLDYVKRFLSHEDLRTTEGYVHAAKALKEQYEQQGLQMLGVEGVFDD